jgi:hypothetical protein
MKTTSLLFVRAYDFLLERNDLKPAEKLILILVCRYWPSPCWDSNATIAKRLGFSTRRVERLLKKLKSKKVIKTGYGHRTRSGKNHTVRIMVPLCIPGKCVLTDFKIDTGQDDGRPAGRNDGSIPSNLSQTTVKMADLLERNRKKIERSTPHLQIFKFELSEGAGSTPLPLPAKGQAKALIENNAISASRPFKRTFLSAQEFEERRRKQIKALMESS